MSFSVTYGSSSNSLSASCTVTKPTSLAVGDIMVAHIVFGWAVTDPTAVTPPSGWTQDYLSKSAANGANVYLAHKIADSSDVAASNFTFTSNASGSPLPLSSGRIVRVTGGRTQDAGIGYVKNSASAIGTSSITVSTITPSKANSLILFFIGEVASTTSSTNSAYAMATSNPTWTELYDDGYDNGANTSTITCAYATRPEVTATGNLTATISQSSQYVAFAFAIEPPITASVSDTVTTTDGTPLGSMTFNTSDTVTETDSVTIDKICEWNNQSKSNTSWTNQPKT